MILRVFITKEECPENDHFLNTQILKKYSSFYVLLFDSGPLPNRLISNGENQRKKEIYQAISFPINLLLYKVIYEH